MNPFKGIMKNTDENIRTGIPLRPDNVPCWNIRHNGQTGQMSIILPDEDPNVENSKGTDFEINSVTFIPLLITKIAKGANGSSNPSLDPEGRYDLYVYTDNGSVNEGIFSNASLKKKFDTQFKVFHRVFGILTKLNGKNIKSYNGESAEYVHRIFPENGIALAYADLSPQKYFSVSQDLKVSYNSVPETIEARFLTLSADRDKNGIHFKPNKNGGSFVPSASISEMDNDVAQRMYVASKDLMNILMKYREDIEKYDNYLKQLMLHGLTSSGTVTKLAEFGVRNSDTLNDALEGKGEEGWQKIYGWLNKPTTYTTEEAERKKTDPFTTHDDAFDVDDDDLPF